ncbi:hypothetical protein [Gordonia sp. NPDC003950]
MRPDRLADKVVEVEMAVRAHTTAVRVARAAPEESVPPVVTVAMVDSAERQV